MKMLINKLNSVCKRALEAAAGLCYNKRHFNVEIEHFLIKLLETIETDIQLIFRHYELDTQSILRHLQVSLDRLPTGNNATPAFSPHLLKLLEESWMMSSLVMGQSEIRSGSILLALIDVDTLRGLILETCPLLLRLSRANLKKDIHEFLKFSKENTAKETKEEVKSDKISEVLTTPLNKSPLELYAKNLTQEATLKKLDPIFGREEEIRLLMNILCRRRQNNPILVGEAGVGKTAIVEGLAQKIVENDVPDLLKEVEIFALDLGLLQAGASVSGEFESRLKAILNDVNSRQRPAILFIDEAHMLMGAGGASLDAANLLKPALARGELRTIAATTWSEYKRFIEKDAALARRFQTIKVHEPTPSSTISMLRIVTEKLSFHHHVFIRSEALEAAVHFSHRFLPERRLPDKALSVLDTACANVALSQIGKPFELETLLEKRRLLEMEKNMLLEEKKQFDDENILNLFGQENEITKRIFVIEKEIENISNKENHIESKWKSQKNLLEKRKNLIIDLKNSEEENKSEDIIIKIKESLHEAQKELFAINLEDRLLSPFVDIQSIAKVISTWTGIPSATILSQGDGLSYQDLNEKLKSKIYGQDLALEAISKRVFSYQLGLSDESKPMGVFILSGPSGVGKTETASALAECLNGKSRGLIRLNMNEYQESHSVATLKGAPPGYVGYGTGGILTEAIRQNPYGVVLMDEFDKAHPDVLQMFYQIFDKGILEDSEGIEVDFKNTLFILTTNLGSDIITDRMHSLKDTESLDIVFEQISSKLRDNLSKELGSAFIGRTDIIPYVPLSLDIISKIIEAKLIKLSQKIKEKKNIYIDYTSDHIQDLAKQFVEGRQNIRALDFHLVNMVIPKLMQREDDLKKVISF